ncbi:N-acetyltransferase family protein [Tepidamorphus sp. 3E244]|uniref:GNAT family N-acetyltransferase n=1 Tax=Tepidamorphus sp. 3E244 TaxID=3385498 RepID=UPI0038FBF6DF
MRDVMALRLPTFEIGGYALSMAIATLDIRHPEPGDGPDLADVFTQSWGEAYRGIIPDIDLRRIAGRRGAAYWNRVFDKNARQLLVASFDGNAVGYVGFGRNRSHRIPAEGEIYELYVDPVYQGSGLGRMLFEAARDRLAVRHFSGLVVWALQANERADTFYRHLGGHVAGEDRIRMLSRDYRRIAYLWR